MAPKLLSPLSSPVLTRNSRVPLSLYLHFPWCRQKCPYCDFNSKVLLAQNTNLIEPYIDHLINDLAWFSRALNRGAAPNIVSVFIGGGSPNLLTARQLTKLIDAAAKYFTFDPKIEVTLEANPVITKRQAKVLLSVGINRLSLGVQSFQGDKLSSIGRLKVAPPAKIKRCIGAVLEAGFTNLNLDLMYGLPSQTPRDACDDLKAALAFNPSHLSWYQLTLSEDRLAGPWARQLALPNLDAITAIEQAGRFYLKQQGFTRYEVSSYASHARYRCKHNLNYWSYGDYLGLGAGASSKLTLASGDVLRWQNLINPAQFLKQPSLAAEIEQVDANKQRLEFMLNAGRLLIKVPHQWWQQRVKGASAMWWHDKLQDLASRGLLQLNASYFKVNARGSSLLDSWLVEF